MVKICQIQLVKRFDNKQLSKKDITGFCNLMFEGSIRNDDAYGVFSENGIITKSNKRLDWTTLNNDLKNIKANMLIGHNRWKTQGSADVMDNNHPFETDNFIVVHNGVLRNDDELKKKYKFDYKVETDSYIISALLEKYYDELRDDYEAVKKTAEEIVGSYSVVVFCKRTNKIFYFKEGNTDFVFALVKNGTYDLLVGSTDKDNVPISFSKTERLVFNVPQEYYLFEPEKHTIYEITGETILQRGTFVEATSYTKSYEKEKPTTIKSMYKQVANELETYLKTTLNLEAMNRKYDYQSRKVSVDVRGGIVEEMRPIIQDEFCMFGTLEFEDFFISNTRFKTTITVDLDGDVVNEWYYNQFAEENNKAVISMCRSYWD